MNQDNDQNKEEENVDDLSEREDAEVGLTLRYAIASYGADYTVEGLVSKLRKGDIFIPPFQRGYVWTWPQASRFIESLLLGLPVPGIFFSKEPKTEKLLVIDGQQRLVTLKYYYDGKLGENKIFKLKGVEEEFEGKTYETLPSEDRRKLDDSTIHAIIVKQEKPSEDQSSVYRIFERLNTGGTALQPQEIRACIHHGPYNNLLNELNRVDEWRRIYGAETSKRMKDQELILRFFALFFDLERYERPMKDFLNKHMGENRGLTKNKKEECSHIFNSTVKAISKHLGPHAFRPVRALNTAVYDAVMIGLAKRVLKGDIQSPELLEKAKEDLFTRDDFKNAYLSGTTDPENVKNRIKIAIQIFDAVK